MATASSTYNRLKSSLPDTNYEELMKHSSDQLAAYVEEYPIATVLTALSGGIIIGAVATMLCLPRSRRYR